MRMNVVEIFTSIDGEGKRAGLPTTFIRLFGCNLHCTYCDTRYGCEGDGYDIMSIQEIMSVCKAAGVKSVTITGGEPLIQPTIRLLVEELLYAGYWVNIETNGSIDVESFRTIVRDINKDDKLFFTVDYKCPCSGMEDKMNMNMFANLHDTDVLKFVVGSVNDMDVALSVLEKTQTCAQVYFSPVFGSIEPVEIVNYILEHKLYHCKVQLQLHKIIWNPETRGV